MGTMGDDETLANDDDINEDTTENNSTLGVDREVLLISILVTSSICLLVCLFLCFFYVSLKKRLNRNMEVESAAKKETPDDDLKSPEIHIERENGVEKVKDHLKRDFDRELRDHHGEKEAIEKD